MIFRRKKKKRTLTDLVDRALLSEEVFSNLLEHERLRSERSSRTFCLLHVGENQSAEELAPVAKRIAREFIRRTDAAGLFREGIGVMLPETGYDGAIRVREKLCSGLNVTCRIYIFPSDQLPEHEQETEITSEQHEQERYAHTEPLESLMVINDSAVKRLVDIVGASAGMIVLSPIILLAMLLVKLSSKGPVFFTQKRAGQGGKPFTMYKLRTMVVDAEALQADLRDQSEQDGPAFKLTHDPRVTWIGQILRKSCIDELPQLWNVLVGEMSLVGPRPLPLSESIQIDDWARCRLRVKPGLTCIWQVDGGRHVQFADWMRMDIRYIQQRTLRQDLNLIFRTAANVLLHRAST